ncbi:YlcI/YnfO family protein [Dyella caseinilytica]|uniref:Prevent-host-death protein n=1 Tax=Dyella caseinilytica TaxID=1849581 RepID=A0ABX7GZ22_9GAMM|nr:YlcI/YnfO family protein [Dyella caseinilytica]QRN55575.1 prevent-host-death protein [Dyella caseinilytica]GGA02807.1 hypothetical protein GCM10011408_25340 [Dyella caseinilytica]
MKSKFIPINSELQLAAEAVLSKGESLSQFIEASLRQAIAHRQQQREFLAYGIASRDEAQRTGKYFDTHEVLARLDGILRTKQSDRQSD